MILRTTQTDTVCAVGRVFHPGQQDFSGEADVKHAHDDVAADRIAFGRSDDSFEKIEDFLARLTQQLQDELQTTRSSELENPRPH